MRALRDRGYEVAAGGTFEPMEVGVVRSEGFAFHEFTIFRSINPVGDLCATAKLTRILRSERFDLTHSQSAKSGIINRLAGRLAGTPVVLHTVHAWPFHDFVRTPARNIFILVERLAARLDDGIVVDSREVVRRGLSARICRREHLHQIYMGIDVQRFHPFPPAERSDARRQFGCAEDEYVIGCAARLVKGKGHDVLIAAAAQVIRRNPRTRCLIAGDGELESCLREQIRSEGLEDRIVLLGRITQMPAFYNALDVLCLPTHREGFGVALAEAMACGTPVVASNIAPLDEVVVQGTGLLKPMEDLAAFRNGLLELMDPARRKRLGLAACKHVRGHFAIERINDQTIELYEALLSRKKRGFRP
jgi:glycosyltransferase involved in cell wall biosynthesis